MLSSIRGALAGFRSSLPSSFAGPIASSSRVTLPPTTALQQVRFRSQLAPRKWKYRKSQKGRPAIPTGGSIKGTTLQFGGFGLRLISAVRLTAAQLTAAQVALKRKIKPIKGAQVHLRVFPDVPVCVKGNETRMGKGKGSFEYWATRVPAGRVVFEIAGGGIREEIARQALKLAQVKIPVPTEFITTATPPRLGSIVSNELSRPVEAQKTVLVHNPLTPIQQVAAAQNGAKESEAEAQAESKEKVQA